MAFAGNCRCGRPYWHVEDQYGNGYCPICNFQWEVMWPRHTVRAVASGQDMADIRRYNHFYYTRTYADDRRISHNFAIRCKYCYDLSWQRYEYHRNITNTYEYYCETCWLWWQRKLYDFRLSTVAKNTTILDAREHRLQV